MVTERPSFKNVARTTVTRQQATTTERKPKVPGSKEGSQRDHPPTRDENQQGKTQTEQRKTDKGEARERWTEKDGQTDERKQGVEPPSGEGQRSPN